MDNQGIIDLVQSPYETFNINVFYLGINFNFCEVRFLGMNGSEKFYSEPSKKFFKKKRKESQGFSLNLQYHIYAL